MVAVHQPFQRQGVPDDLAVFVGTHLLYHLSQVATWDGILFPTVVYHQVVAHAVGVDYHLDAFLAQVAKGLDVRRLALGRCQTLREQGDGVVAVESVLVVEAYGQTQHEVRLPVSQILESLLLRAQLDDIGDVEFFHDQTDQVDVEAVGLAVVVKEGVWPQVPRVLIHQRILLCIYSCGVAFSRHGRQ